MSFRPAPGKQCGVRKCIHAHTESRFRFRCLRLDSLLEARLDADDEDDREGEEEEEDNEEEGDSEPDSSGEASVSSLRRERSGWPGWSEMDPNVQNKARVMRLVSCTFLFWVSVLTRTGATCFNFFLPSALYGSPTRVPF